MTFTAAQRTSMTTTSYTAFLATFAAILVLFTLVAHARYIARWAAATGGRGEVWKGWVLRAGQRGSSPARGEENKEGIVAAAVPQEDADIERELVQEKKVTYEGAGSPSNKLFPAMTSRPLSTRPVATLVPPRQTRLNSSTPLTSNFTSQSGQLPTLSSLLYTTSNTPTLTNTNTKDSKNLEASPPSAASINPPPYFPSLLPSQLIYPLPAFLLKIGIDLTIAQTLLIVIYGIAAGLAVFWYSDPAHDPVRSGVLATVQLPIIVALGTKNSVISAMIGRGSETFNFLHRFVGRSIFLFSSMHAGHYFHLYMISGTFSASLKSQVIWTGCLAWLAMVLVILTSIPIIRRKAFQFFLITHTLGFLTLLIALIFHVPLCIPFCASSLGLYGLDILLRFALKTRMRKARFEALSDGKTTMVEIGGVTGGWRAGQHVYLRVLSPSLGPLKMLTSHPFTIASSDSGSEPLRFFIKSQSPGSWTSSLHSFARFTSPSSASSLESTQLPGRECRVLIDGPYGGPGNTLPSAFSSVLLVSGGSGITFSLSHTKTLLDRSLTSSARARSVDLVWVVPSYASVVPFLPYLLPLVRARAEYDARDREEKTYPVSPGVEKRSFGAGLGGGVRPIKVNMRIWVTRPEAQGSREEALIPRGVEGLTILLGRPDLGMMIREKVEETIQVVQTLAEGDGCGLGVGVCGPAGLVRSTREVVAGLKTKEISKIGGVEVFAEHFGV